jgi:hypothetical protein
VFGPGLATTGAVCAAGSLAWPDGLKGDNSRAPMGIGPMPNLPRTKSGYFSDAVTNIAAWLQPAAR